jgi:glycosyltransferase involved in cell wall biosynthesis
MVRRADPGMTRLYFAIPGDIHTPTGGYAYDRRVMALLPAFGVEVAHLALPAGFPFPSAAELDATSRLLADIPGDAAILIDGLAFGALPERCLTGIRAPIIVLLHHPLGLETGLDEQESRRLLTSEQAALSFARHIIVTSLATAATLVELAFAELPRITVAEPGTEPAARATGSGDGICEILSVGSVIPRKGHDLLVTALARMPHRGWHCTIVGSLDRDCDFVARLRQQIAEFGLQDTIHLTGALESEALALHYDKADIFALPSRYEGYGMAFAAALARGLPIVAAKAGAVPSTVPAEAGLMVPPEDAQALSEALHALIGDRAVRRRLSDAAWTHAQSLPRWDDTARIIAGVIRKIGL